MGDSNETVALSREQTAGASDAAPTPAAAPTAAGAVQPDAGASRVSPQEFLRRRRTAQSAYVFDLRDGDAFAAKHLAGAYSLPFEHVEPNLHRLPFSGDLLFYDGGDGQARQMAAVLTDNGFSEFFFVEEGLEGLLAALAEDAEEVQYEKLDAQERAAKVEQVLDSRVREFLARDGGGMEVMSIEDDRVLVSYQGACGSCSSSTAGTLRFVQNMLTISLNHEIEVVPVEQ